MRPRSLFHSRGTLAELLSGRTNSFGLLRLLLATSVVVSHVYPLAWGHLDPLWKHSGEQTDLGKMAVIGFFVLSGFMITGSGRRTTVGRYAWHRAMRILPGLWGSLVVSTLVIMPFLYQWQHHTLDGFWSHPNGPETYLTGTWNTSLTGGWDVSGVIAEGVRRGTNFDGSVNGALWSLKYELLCYLVVGLLAAGGVLLRARRLVPLVTVALWGLILNDWIDAPGWRGIPGDMDSTLSVPLLGPLSIHFIVHLGFVFLLGATFQLYRERIAVHDGLALLSALAFLVTLRWGGVFVIGYPAFAYLLLWLATRLPGPFRKIGRKRDYSYGIYIYGFTVEQSLAMLGYARYGKLGFLGCALAGTVALAALSWHLIESPAMRLKDWTPGPISRLKARRGGGSGGAADGPEPGNVAAAPEHADPATSVSP
ncbi:acyltransferase [Streptomyces kaniharaensis]|uniref:Acyltransferase n=1 Tax=Streptomyces kaniharaensis TaxID=212423 RepID=A0A6N7KMI6_9ACTN|nr:acyltransferase [Streptomyces kaniharaensis]MQS12706.1 acyltransferase [Streptomyces kaniharaensis]